MNAVEKVLLGKKGKRYGLIIILIEVFQVVHVRTKKVYAMKCIRKDVVIKNESMDSLKLEKEILYEVNHPFIVGMEYVFQTEQKI